MRNENANEIRINVQKKVYVNAIFKNRLKHL